MQGKFPALATSNDYYMALAYAVRDWNFAGVLRYQSGEVIRTPASNNSLLGQLARLDNPGGFGGGKTTWNKEIVASCKMTARTTARTTQLVSTGTNLEAETTEPSKELVVVTAKLSIAASIAAYPYPGNWGHVAREVILALISPNQTNG
jgi:hypothetical protein